MVRGEDTRERLRQTALQLFSEQGYDAVTVAQLARAAGVSHMTFFRHFATKEAVVVDDLFDPMIAAAIAAQPLAWPPLRRAAQGLSAALEDEQAGAELRSVAFAQRIGLVASTPSLRGAVWAASQATEDAMAGVLSLPTVSPSAARAAAGAVMGAATAILLAWAGRAEGQGPGVPADQALRDGLSTLLGETP